MSDEAWAWMAIAAMSTCWLVAYWVGEWSGLTVAVQSSLVGCVSGYAYHRWPSWNRAAQRGIRWVVMKYRYHQAWKEKQE